MGFFLFSMNLLWDNLLWNIEECRGHLRVAAGDSLPDEGVLMLLQYNLDSILLLAITRLIDSCQGIWFYYEGFLEDVFEKTNNFHRVSLWPGFLSTENIQSVCTEALGYRATNSFWKGHLHRASSLWWRIISSELDYSLAITMATSSIVVLLSRLFCYPASVSSALSLKSSPGILLSANLNNRWYS